MRSAALHRESRLELHRELNRRVDRVQQCWSRTERRQRAELGQQRAAGFVAAFVEDHFDDPTVWAVGSLTPDDIERIHGEVG